MEQCKHDSREKIAEHTGGVYDDKGNLIYDMWDCPCCGRSYEIEYDDYKYCPECGQAIDRSDLDKLV